MSPRLFLHGDSIVSPLFHSPRRLDGLSGSAGRLPAGSYSSRFASLSSLRGRRKDVPVQGPLLRSHNRAPSLHEDYGSHFRHPPQVWTIDSSWPIQNSSLVYLGVEIRSLPFMARPPPVRVSNLLRLLEEFLSTPSVKEYLSLFQSQTSASYQTLRMCVAGPHYYYYYIPDCKPQLGELDAKNPKAPAGKTAQ